MTSRLVEAFLALDEDQCVALVQQRVEEGIAVADIIEECRIGMSQVGGRYASGEFFLAELVMAAHVFGECMNLIEPLIEVSAASNCGTIVVGTVAGDIHDLGKNLFCSLLRAEGFEVIDLGVDVPPERFVEAVREHRAPIVGLSCLLTVAFDAMRRTVEAFDQAGMRSDVTILLGGGVISERVCRTVGADDFTTDAVEGVRKCREIVSAQHRTEGVEK